jgi:predicted DCC family thiol-disulfide oxidoreductase YuxK
VTPAGPLILFDTDCVLCSGMVAFVLAHEAGPTVSFVGAWSPEGLALAALHGVTRAELEETFLLIDGPRVAKRSDAALILARHLRAPWRWLGMLAIIPRPLRDAAYRHVARRRYRWFGRRQDCTVVPPGQRHRFIGVPGRNADA